MGAVWGGAEGGLVETEVLGGEEGRAVGEDYVVGGEAFFGGHGGGNDENGVGAEAEAEDGAVDGREEGESLVEGLVGSAGDEMEVADYGEEPGNGGR